MPKQPISRPPEHSQTMRKPRLLDDVDRFREQRAKETPGVDTEPMAILGRIGRIAHRVSPHMEALFAAYGLERGEFDVLATLQRSGPPYRLTPTELSRSLMITSGGLTYRLNRLTEAGFITRRPAADDGRSLLVELTPEGYRRAALAFEEDMHLQGSWLSALPAQDRAKLADLLRSLFANIPEFTPHQKPSGKTAQNGRRQSGDDPAALASSD